MKVYYTKIKNKKDFKNVIKYCKENNYSFNSNTELNELLDSYDKDKIVEVSFYVKEKDSFIGTLSEYKVNNKNYINSYSENNYTFTNKFRTKNSKFIKFGLLILAGIVIYKTK